MLDINLTASLLKAVPHNSQVLFIGDADQLPSVGAGNVLRDMIIAEKVPCFRLTKIFRQAQESRIVRIIRRLSRFYSGTQNKIGPLCGLDRGNIQFSGILGLFSKS